MHLSVHPPGGRVTLVVPSETRPEVARAYAASRMPWIRDKQEKLRGQARETPRPVALMDKHYRTWREARAELNELPLAAEAWSRG